MPIGNTFEAKYGLPRSARKLKKNTPTGGVLMADLKYSEETFRDMYEALKQATERLSNEGRAYEQTIWVCEKALAKAEGKSNG